MAKVEIYAKERERENSFGSGKLPFALGIGNWQSHNGDGIVRITTMSCDRQKGKAEEEVEGKDIGERFGSYWKEERNKVSTTRKHSNIYGMKWQSIRYFSHLPKKCYFDVNIEREICLLKKNRQFLSPNIRAVFWLSDEIRASVRVEETGKGIGIRCPRDENMGRKFWVTAKRYALRISSSLEEGKRRISATCPRREKSFPKVVVVFAAIAPMELGSCRDSVDGWHSYKQLLLRQR